jgi:hypothetical protein
MEFVLIFHKHHNKAKAAAEIQYISKSVAGDSRFKVHSLKGKSDPIMNIPISKPKFQFGS